MTVYCRSDQGKAIWDLTLSKLLTIEEHGELEPFYAAHAISIIEAEVLFAKLDLKLAQLGSCLILVHLVVHGIILTWLSLAKMGILDRFTSGESLLFPCSFHLCKFISYN
jgi:hypothetical protein